jgi:hypothetical protein
LVRNCGQSKRDVAQSGLERVPWAHEVAGSNPVIPTKRENHMKQDTMLVQCVLQQSGPHFNKTTTVWLEAERVGVGKQVLVSDAFDKDDEKQWWTVTSVGSEKVPYGKLADKQRTSIWDVSVNKLRGNK